MRNDIKLVDVPEKFKLVLGEPDPGTRLYKAYGTEEEGDIWWDVFEEAVPDHGYSPGGAAGYVRVTRTAVHKRIKEGRLSAFAFYTVKHSIFSIKKVKLEYKKNPTFILIPMSEIKQWREIMDKKRNRGEKLNIPTHKTDNGYSEIWGNHGNWRKKLGIKEKK